MKKISVSLFIVISLLGMLLSCAPGQAGPPAMGTPGQQAGTVIVSPTPTSCATTPAATPAPTSTPTPLPAPTPTAEPAIPAAPLQTGKVILVSLARQWLYAYADGAPAFNNAVETGRPELPTPTGSFSVLQKLRSVTFTSSWPPGSPYYYDPTFINYALLFRADGYFLHDAWWHVKFGPGSNILHQLPDGNWETGSHGCIGLPIPDAHRLYDWTPIGTPVIIRRT